MGTKPYYLYGTSVSKHNKRINWNLVKTTPFSDFTFIKVSETEVTDPLFLENWISAGIVGIPRGGILFFRPYFDARKQGMYFCQQLKRVGIGEIVPIIYLEDSGKCSTNEVTNNLITLIKDIERDIQVFPIIISSKEFLDNKLEKRAELKRYLYGIIYPNPVVNYPETSSIFRDWAVWQYTSNGSVNGIMGNAELNRMRVIYKKRMSIERMSNGT